MIKIVYAGYRNYSENEGVYHSLITLSNRICEYEGETIEWKRFESLDGLNNLEADIMILDHLPNDKSELLKALNITKDKTLIMTGFFINFPDELTKDPEYDNVYYIDKMSLPKGLVETLKKYLH